MEGQIAHFVSGEQLKQQMDVMKRSVAETFENASKKRDCTRDRDDFQNYIDNILTESFETKKNLKKMKDKQKEFKKEVKRKVTIEEHATLSQFIEILPTREHLVCLTAKIENSIQDFGIKNCEFLYMFQ